MEPAVQTLGITSMLKNQRLKEAQRKRDAFMDCGIGTLLDGYTENELLLCVQACWRGQEAMEKAGEKRKKQTAPQWASFHRTILDLLWGQALVLQGESFHKAELYNLFTLPIKN